MRYRAILIDLETRTPLHVGSGQGDATTDALLGRDTQGRLVLRGSAIAGAMRALATRLAPRFQLGTRVACTSLLGDEASRVCGCSACQLFGDLYPGVVDEAAKDDDPDTGGRASRIWFYNARPESGLVAGPIRDHVGISRSTAAADRAAGAKFDQEFVPAGTRFRLRLELDDDLAANELDLLAAVLAEWKQGKAVLGGRSARGLGALNVQEPRLVCLDLGQPESLMAFLRSDSPWESTVTTVDSGWVGRRVDELRKPERVRPAKGLPAAVVRGRAALSFDIQAEELFLTHDPTVAVHAGFDHATLLDHEGLDGRPWLPGSSLRGALRFQAERIARTLATLHRKNLDDFVIHCPACDPLVNAHEEPRNEPLASCDSLLGDWYRSQGQEDRGEARLDNCGEPDPGELCLACRLFGSTRLGSRLRVGDSPLAEGTSPVLKAVDFLAIDRFTGGGRDKAKFDALALWKPRFRAEIQLDNPAGWELGWLLLTLRDLHDGLTGLGFGTSKGFGRVTLHNLKLAIGTIDEADLKHLAGAVDMGPGLPSGVFLERILEAKRFDEIGAGWKVCEGWVHEFVRTVKAFARSEKLRLQEDDYFGRSSGAYPLEQLYPRSVKVSDD